MKQLIQSLRTGSLELIDAPIPTARPGYVVIQTYASIISKGTEEALLEFGRASWLKKAKLQPEKVAQIKAKLKTDGFKATITSIRTKLDKPISPGYSQSGVVVAVGTGVSQFSIGDRVVSNGSHAEYVCVPHQLCVKIPSDLISFEEAAFTTIASIALQGVRLLNPSLGECVVVQGLGLIGLITVQILRAHGCKVLGIDYDGKRLELAKQFGAEVHSLSQDPNPVMRSHIFSSGNGVDGVIVTASTLSSEPIRFAAEMSRQRGKIILVGTTGTQFNRNDFYKKEISLQVACSYGPGRYDRNYEDKGFDYPIGFVRWTENRNMESILWLLKNKMIDLKPLISHRFPFDLANEAYDLISSKKPCLGIALSYPRACQTLRPSLMPRFTLKKTEPANLSIGLIGAGEHATRVLIPALKKLKILPSAVCSQNGLSASILAKRNKIPFTFSSADELIGSSSIDTVVISTQHDSHSELVMKAILANKHVFVEKPLALSLSEISEIETLLSEDNFNKIFWLGFNRRFSPLSKTLKTLLASCVGPKQMIYTVNALPIQETHWTHDSKSGGGRITSEIGHFIDLLCFFAASPIVQTQSMRISHDLKDPSSSISVTLGFEDGSLGTLNYCTVGNRNYPKERVEIFVDGKVAVLDNFKTLEGFGFSNFKKTRLWFQDKGHDNCIGEFINAIKTQDLDSQRNREVLEISKITCRLQDSKTSAFESELKVA